MSNSSSSILVGVLGPLEVKVHGVAVALGTAKQRALLAVLAINANRVVGMDALIDAVWGQQASQSTRPTLHAYVSNLRRVISTGCDPRDLLARVKPGYRLNIDDSCCDLGRFRGEVKSGLACLTAGDCERASEHLTAALAEWRGGALEDLDMFGFANAFARAQTDDKLVAYTGWAEAENSCGRSYSIISQLESLVVEYPYHEPLWAQLITAHYLAERQSDALDAYRRLKTVLADDLGIDPGPAVRALYHRVLQQLPLAIRKPDRLSARHTVVRTGSDPIAVVALLRDSSGRTYPITGETTRIGRSSQNDIVLMDETVSRHHAVIVNTAGNFAIRDLGSANGVYLTDERISSECTLKVGDRIRLGDISFTFEEGP